MYYSLHLVRNSNSKDRFRYSDGVRSRWNRRSCCTLLLGSLRHCRSRHPTLQAQRVVRRGTCQLRCLTGISPWTTLLHHLHSWTRLVGHHLHPHQYADDVKTYAGDHQQNQTLYKTNCRAAFKISACVCNVIDCSWTWVRRSSSGAALQGSSAHTRRWLPCQCRLGQTSLRCSQ